MPIPHLSKKVRSPHTWQKGRIKELKRTKRRINKRRKKAKRFFDVKKGRRKKSIKLPLGTLLKSPFLLFLLVLSDLVSIQKQQLIYKCLDLHTNYVH